MWWDGDDATNRLVPSARHDPLLLLCPVQEMDVIAAIKVGGSQIGPSYAPDATSAITTDPHAICECLTTC